MGLLTDPSLGQRNQLGRNLIKHARKICIVLYLAGVGWFCCLGYTDFNHSTYLSENALSPGLVYSEVKQESARYGQSILEELSKERENHKSSIPYAWLLAKMKQLGLETHTHNFTLKYPFGGKKKFQGKNVYGILRAPRIGSTEGIIFSTPYRPPNSIHTDISSSIPILLAFANFARKKNYWAKDLIFLVTDQEQLGMHAWLEAYYQGNQNIDKNILDVGNLPARAGALQAALNLEIQDFDNQYLDVKIEGLNGQLPNLDMFNLVQRLAIRESLTSGYKQTGRKKRSLNQQTIPENIKQMLSMLLTQANGVPTGNHGFFHRYRIESLTLESIKKESSNNHNRILGAISLLKTIEGISRSLNNLLERFHQSFFFYILVANDRFVSIGDFMPCLILMSGSLYIKAFLIWLSIDTNDDSESSKSERDEKNKKLMCRTELPYDIIGKIFGITIFFGILAKFLPLNEKINDYFANNAISTEVTLSFILVVIAIVGFVLPFFIHVTEHALELLHVISLLYLGSVLIVVGLLNFALGFLVSVFVTPLAILLNLHHKPKVHIISIIYTFLLHPLVISYLVIFSLTSFSFPELEVKTMVIRALRTTMDALTFTIVDSIIYNNWLFTISSMLFFPAWLLFWILNLSRCSKESKKKLKIK